MNIALLWSTWHIAKWLIYCFSQNVDHNLFLFSRSPDSTMWFLTEHNIDAEVFEYSVFHQHKYDVIINCIGIGAPLKLGDSHYQQMIISEIYDTMVIKYLDANNGVKYIYLSSGAVYNNSFLDPVSDMSVSQYSLNSPSIQEYYGVSKIYTEYKHRALAHLSIIDIRIFSYFSRFIDLNAWFFLSDVLASIKNKSILQVSNTPMNRDYIGHTELFDMIECFMSKKTIINIGLDWYSSKHISKEQVLNIFSQNFWLKYELINSNSQSPTGCKMNYYSLSRRAWEYGYVPIRSSEDILIDESRIFLSQK